MEANGEFSSSRTEHLASAQILLLRLLAAAKGFKFDEWQSFLADPVTTRLVKTPRQPAEKMEERRERDSNHFKALEALYGVKVKEYTREEWEKIKKCRTKSQH